MKKAYCGKNCEECAIYKATQKSNIFKLAKLAHKTNEIFGTNLNHNNFLCDGCKENGRKTKYRLNCKVAICCQEKGYETCEKCYSHNNCRNMNLKKFISKRFLKENN